MPRTSRGISAEMNSSSTRKPPLSVIIPVLNEEGVIGGILEDLSCQDGLDFEVIVSDGGSQDATQKIVARFGAQFVSGRPGRAVQLNAGAGEARGQYLLFLHADSRLPDGGMLAEAVSFLEARIADRGRDSVAGHFALNFIREQTTRTLAWAYLEAKSSLNRENTTNGDQGFLISSSYFHRLKGFDESLPYFEDQRLAERIRESGEWVTLPGVVQTSSRRFEKEGFGKRYTMMAVMMGVHHAGLPGFFQKAERLYVPHHEPGIFLVSPQLDLIQQSLRELGKPEKCRFWLSVGHYVRSHAWQIFFLMDVALSLVSGRRLPRACTGFHDRILEPLLDFRVFDIITACLVFIWFHLLARPWYRIRETAPKRD